MLFSLTIMATITPTGSAGAAECAEYAVEAERELGIPRGLLLAMSLVESGRSGDPHPYAMNINGRSVYAGSREEAVGRLRDSAGRLISKATVGCMQLSVYHHRSAFKPVERILDPEHNVGYAARYLRRLHDEMGSWTAAVARYNGASYERTQAYVCKVWRHLSALDAASAEILDVKSCDPGVKVAIGPRTRNTFRRSETAALPDR